MPFPTRVDSHQSDTSAAHTPQMLARLVCVLCIFVFSAMHLMLGMKENEFHFQAHPDEVSKISQMIKGERNLHHPLFMLNSVNFSMRMAAKFIPKRYESDGSIEKKISPQDCAVIGRNMSALYSAAGVLCASLAVGFSISWIAGAMAAGFLGICPLTIILAHFLKEDASLCLGMGLFLLAFVCHGRSPSKKSAIFLGAALAVLVSTKWIGLFPGAGCIGLAITIPQKSSFKIHWGWMLASAVTIFAWINYQMWMSPGESLAEFQRETQKLSRGAFEGETAQGFYGTWHFEYLWEEMSDWTIPLAAVGILSCLLNRLGPLWRSICITMVLQTLALGFSKAASTRYIMPSVFYAQVLAALGLFVAVQFLIERRSVLSAVSAVASMVCAFLLLREHTSRSLQAVNQFQEQTVDQAWNWIRQHLAGKEATMVQFDRHRLPGHSWINDPTTPPLPVRVLTLTKGDSVLTYHELKQKGATHLILRLQDRRKLFGLDAGQLEMKRSFYNDLETHGTIVFSVPTGPIFWCQPGLEIIELN